MLVACFFIFTRLRPGAVDSRIFRSREDRMLGGVFGGLGERFGFAPLWLRLAWCALFFLFPVRFPLMAGYVLLWAITPREPLLVRPITLEERLGTGVAPHQVRSSFEDPALPY
jgi:phage shock protein PspC (stress-responsive transcriptional regulator)